MIYPPKYLRAFKKCDQRLQCCNYCNLPTVLPACPMPIPIFKYSDFLARQVASVENTAII